MTQELAPVLQLRVIVEAHDYDEAVWFYRDALGLPEQAAFANGGDDRVAILDAGRATLEIASPTHKVAVDAAETGGPASPAPVRLAFEVTDSAGTVSRLVEAGAQLVAPVTMTPWRSLNARLDAPAGQQITVFQETESLADRSRRAGFAVDGSRD
ncbi:VOC family protein [Nocardioides guangzhouensis]|uniref:VOC family protein n=1 Tax=Nocardioides guangzhouensis TaxID=2497878 RepID=A0A4Q4Z063_9ACTN|nr:VOC family protein [Nocardioides guangzhouensis]RYP80917.1 VOC family protein [Nocardioides guangzhouensis]